jgi:dipeptidyl aminopeptidase/acylaminoacyl peptidase
MHGFARFLLFTVFFFFSLAAISKVLPTESFSQLPQYTRLNLSPSGEQIAYIINFQDPEVAVLTTVNLLSGEKKYLIKSDNEEVKVNWFTWANEKTLIVSVRFASSRSGVDTTETRLVSINVNDKEIEQRDLIKPRSGNTFGGSGQHFSQFQDNVVSFLPNDPEHILVAVDLEVANLPDVYKINVNNGKKSRITKGKLAIRDWMADRQGNLRLGESLNYKTGEASLRVRIGDDDKWHSLFEYNALEEPGVNPLGFALDPNILYYSAYQNDKRAIFTINLQTQQTTLVYADENYDVDGGLIYSRKTRDVIGIYHANSANGRIYWDAERNNFQQALNKALPDSDNYLVDFSDDENIYILYTENDYTPGAYYLGNRKNNSLDFIFEQYPGLNPEVLAEHELVTYTARDGTKIEGYLTRPLGMDKPVATILHPHGGPGAREMDGFDYWTAFFANRGYAVFRPNFRGSSGYGYAFAQSQMKGWGLTMQDDLTDAAKWLVEQKVADPERMCIVGASYGGYAAQMAAVKTPELFKCAISFAGVSDLKRLVRGSRHYLNRKFVKQQIGDDSDDLESRSPYYQADKITIPLLLIHGEDDRVVDVEQSRNMLEELEDMGKTVEYIEFAKGDHNLSLQRNRHTTFKAMETFLRRHLGE